MTIWTGVVFWRGRARMSVARPVLAGAFILWGIHTSTILLAASARRSCAACSPTSFIFAIGLGLLFLVLGDERDRCRREPPNWSS